MPYKCSECGIWWAGIEHRCKPSISAIDANDFTVYRVYPEPTLSGGTSSIPWCGICQGLHIPGHGPCTALYY